MLIRFILLLTLWIQPLIAFTQTDTTYCLSIRKARLLVSDAYTKRIQDSLINAQGEKIIILESEKATIRNDFNIIIHTEEGKTKAAILRSDNWKQTSEVTQKESDHYKKAFKKTRRQRNAAIILGLLLLGLSLGN